MSMISEALLIVVFQVFLTYSQQEVIQQIMDSLPLPWTTFHVLANFLTAHHKTILTLNQKPS
jgi:hypothetical protein